MIKYLKISFLLLLFHVTVMAQSQPAERRISREEYINTYKEDAIREMHSSGVPASITLAQGMLESDYGNSPLAKYARNHFGIKCHKTWSGPTFIQDDDEANECFRKYHDAYDSYRDHSDFLRTRDRYSGLFELKITDYKGWARGLKAAGYATNPKYAPLLIKIIEENQLYEYDKTRKMPAVAKNKPAPKHQPKKEMEKPIAARKSTKRAIDVHDNDIEYVHAEKGDTYYGISQEFNMGLWQIYKYNDLEKNAPLSPGDVIYLQPKRRKAKVDFHLVMQGETMREISQKYGIKLKYLYEKNEMVEGSEPKQGDRLYLRKSKGSKSWLSKLNFFSRKDQD